MSESRAEFVAGWHLDKRVPLSLILAIFVQTAAAIWWAAKVDGRITAMEIAQDHRYQLESEVQTLKTNIAVMQQDILYMRRGVERIENSLSSAPSRRKSE